jgi:hypothetical protein
MDRIEHVEESADNGLQPPSQEAFPGLPQEQDFQPLATSTSTRAAPRLRRRSRQPSIRLRRLSSASNIHQQEATGDTESATQETPQLTQQQSGIPAGNNAEDSGQANRRRSNSEPRPGRWSALPLIVVPGVQTSSHHPMSPVTEETGRPSMDMHNVERFAALNALSPAATAEKSNNGEGEVSGQEQEQVPTGRPGMLRRASNAALSALGGRNRASTMAGPISTQRHLAPDEYDSRIVDLLDVIGESDLLYTPLF